MEENKELQWAIDHSMNTDCYPDVFDLNIGMDFHLDEHPNWYVKVDTWREKRTALSFKLLIVEGDQCGILNISTEKKMSWNTYETEPMERYVPKKTLTSSMKNTKPETISF